MPRGVDTRRSSRRGLDLLKRPTQADIAAATHLAVSTVSRALSRPDRVTAETAALVWEAAERLGYRTSTHFRGLSPTTGLLAVLVSDMTNPFFADLLAGAREAAGSFSKTLLVFDTRESETTERAALRALVGAVDAVLMANSRMTDTAIERATRQLPLVVLNRRVVGVTSLVADTAIGIRQALLRLHEPRHRRLVYVAGPSASWASASRWRSIQDEAAALGMSAVTTGATPPTEEGGRQAAAALVAAPPTAVLCYNDVMAIGVIHELGRHGLDVPADVSVVGFDNIRGAEWVRPQLATVASPQRALARAGVGELMRQLDGEPHRTRPIVIPTKFVPRPSIARARRGSSAAESATTEATPPAESSTGS